MKLGEMLQEAGIVTAAQIDDVMSHDERRLGSALIAAGVVDPEVVARTLAQQHGIPAISLAALAAAPASTRALVPDVVGRRHVVVALAVRGAGAGRVLTVAMRDPSDLVALDELAFATGLKIEPRVAPELLLRAALDAPPAAAAPVEVAPPAEVAAPAPSGFGPARGRRPITTPSPTAPAGVPLTYLPAGSRLPSAGAQTVATVVKVGTALVALVGLIYFATAYKRCFTSTTRAVGTHYDAPALRLGIDFPDSGWRLAPGVGKQVRPQAEYFFRGGVPELPFVGMILLRGEAGEIAAAAETLAAELVKDVRALDCRASYARAGGYMCRAMGTIGLFGSRMQYAEIEVHTWRGTTDTIIAVMIKPDRTLSETEYILGSITEQ